MSFPSFSHLVENGGLDLMPFWLEKQTDMINFKSLSSVGRFLMEADCFHNGTPYIHGNNEDCLLFRVHPKTSMHCFSGSSNAKINVLMSLGDGASLANNCGIKEDERLHEARIVQTASKTLNKEGERSNVNGSNGSNTTNEPPLKLYMPGAREFENKKLSSRMVDSELAGLSTPEYHDLIQDKGSVNPFPSRFDSHSDADIRFLPDHPDHLKSIHGLSEEQIREFERRKGLKGGSVSTHEHADDQHLNSLLPPAPTCTAIGSDPIAFSDSWDHWYELQGNKLEDQWFLQIGIINPDLVDKPWLYHRAKSRTEFEPITSEMQSQFQELLALEYVAKKDDKNHPLYNANAYMEENVSSVDELARMADGSSKSAQAAETLSMALGTNDIADHNLIPFAEEDQEDAVARGYKDGKWSERDAKRSEGFFEVKRSSEETRYSPYKAKDTLSKRDPNEPEYRYGIRVEKKKEVENAVDVKGTAEATSAETVNLKDADTEIAGGKDKVSKEDGNINNVASAGKVKVSAEDSEPASPENALPTSHLSETKKEDLSTKKGAGKPGIYRGSSMINLSKREGRDMQRLFEEQEKIRERNRRGDLLMSTRRNAAMEGEDGGYRRDDVNDGSGNGASGSGSDSDPHSDPKKKKQFDDDSLFV